MSNFFKWYIVVLRGGMLLLRNFTSSTTYGSCNLDSTREILKFLLSRDVLFLQLKVNVIKARSRVYYNSELVHLPPTNCNIKLFVAISYCRLLLPEPISFLLFDRKSGGA